MIFFKKGFAKYIFLKNSNNVYLYYHNFIKLFESYDTSGYKQTKPIEDMLLIIKLQKMEKDRN